MPGSRGLTAEVLAAIVGPAVTLAYISEIGLENGEKVRTWSGVGPITFQGEVFVGVGNEGGFGPVQEDQDLRANQVTFFLEGIKPSLVAAALSSIRPREKAKLWMTLIDSDGSIIPDPVCLWRGFTDVPELQFGAKTSKISIITESRLIELEQSIGTRYTDADQQHRFPGDLGFVFVPSLQERRVVIG